MYIYDNISPNSFLALEMFQAKIVEKIKIYILYSVNFFFENRAVYEIMWKTMVKPDMTILNVARALHAG
jgi:hypothetical protein